MEYVMCGKTCSTVFAWSLLLLSANLSFFVAFANGIDVSNLKGHMEPVGNQGSILRGQIAEFETLIPGYIFYRDFWLKGKPAIFRGVLNNVKAKENWPNERYMRDNYGSVYGIVDRRTTWERGGIESPPRTAMNFSEFLDRLPHEQLYWDDEIPRKHHILRELLLPLALDCEEIRKTFVYANLMVNSGKVSYVLHRDYTDNFFHFFAGEKTWLLANSTFGESMYMGLNTQAKDFSPVSPDAVDLIKYPRMTEVEYHEIILNPGDILYVPRNWPHYVRSKGTPNIAMNIWFGSRHEMGDQDEQPKCRRQIRTVKSMLKKRKSI